MINKDQKTNIENMLKNTIVKFQNGYECNLLNEYSEQIIINCNGGHISDVKPLLRFK